MEIIFATTNEGTAFNNLVNALPEYTITKENAEPILKLVRSGQIRVGDPYMYGNTPIYPEPNCDIPKATEIIKDWMSSLLKRC